MTTAKFRGGNVSAPCTGCDGTITSFEYKESSHEFGAVYQKGNWPVGGTNYTRKNYRLLRCASCGMGGLGIIVDNGTYDTGQLLDFLPHVGPVADLPEQTPDDIVKEYREAELCLAAGAQRAAAAMLRSVLEKTLIANGYSDGSLMNKIDKAAEENVITEARCALAHDEIRTIGNDVLHEGWREVSPEEAMSAHHYAQRIIEDFYDDRSTVKTMLEESGRLTSETET